MHERGEVKTDKRNILILPRDPLVEKTLQDRLDEHIRLLEDPSTENVTRSAIIHELPILKRLFKSWSVNFQILELEMKRELGHEFNQDLFNSARSFVLAVCTTDAS